MASWGGLDEVEARRSWPAKARGAADLLPRERRTAGESCDMGWRGWKKRRLEREERAGAEVAASCADGGGVSDLALWWQRRRSDRT